MSCCCIDEKVSKCEFEGFWDGGETQFVGFATAGREIDAISWLVYTIRLAISLAVIALSIAVSSQLANFSVPGPPLPQGVYSSNNTYWFNPECASLNFTTQLQQSCPLVVFQSGCRLDSGKYSDIALPICSAVFHTLFMVVAMVPALKQNNQDPSCITAGLHMTGMFVGSWFALPFWLHLRSALPEDLCSPMISQSLSVPSENIVRLCSVLCYR